MVTLRLDDITRQPVRLEPYRCELREKRHWPLTDKRFAGAIDVAVRCRVPEQVRISPGASLVNIASVQVGDHVVVPEEVGAKSVLRVDLPDKTEFIDVSIEIDTAAVVDCGLPLDCDRDFDIYYWLEITELSSGDIRQFLTRPVPPDDPGPLPDLLPHRAPQSETLRLKQLAPKMRLRFEDADGIVSPLLTFAEGDTSAIYLSVANAGEMECSPSAKEMEITFAQIGTNFDNDNSSTVLPAWLRLPCNPVSVPALAKGESTRIAVHVDFGPLVNPVEGDVSLRCAYRYLSSGKMVTGTATVCNVTAELYAPKFELCGIMPNLDGEQVCDLTHRRDIVEIDDIVDVPRFDPAALSTQTPMPLRVRLEYRNTALRHDPQHPHAALVVGNIKIAALNFGEENDAKLVPRGARTLDALVNLRFVDGAPVGSGSQTNIWRLDAGEALRVNLDVDTTAIKDIVPSKVSSVTTIMATVEANVIADATGESYGNEPQFGPDNLYTTRLRLSLRMMPSGWLSIDFGTSAVSASADDWVVDLKGKKENLLKHLYPPGDPRRDNNDEAEGLISSTICLNPAAGAGTLAQDLDHVDVAAGKICNLGTRRPLFGDLPLWFSPSEGMIDTSYLLPCLKLLIGYNSVPDIFTDNVKETFSYSTVDNPSARLYNDDGTPGDLLVVQSVFEIVYRQFFNYYIGTSSDINQLVLTVPNTYTALHRRALRDIVRRACPSVYPESLLMVSESDAVAYFYVANRKRFHNDLDAADKRRKCEYALIYDMGAGTLDLTYFKIETDTDADGRTKTKVTILDKVGITKGGNYLDYILGQILLDLCRTRNLAEPSQLALLADLLNLNKDEAVARNVTSADRDVLRRWLRNTLKPMLSSGDNKFVPALSTTSGMGNGLRLEVPKYTFTVGDFTNHALFKEYVDDVTHKVLADLWRYANKMPLDTVILSGRGSSLDAVRNGVVDALKGIVKTQHDMLYADLGEYRLRRIPMTVDPARICRLKNVVAEGARCYARLTARGAKGYTLSHPPYFGRFGVIVKRTDGTYNWHPMIRDGMLKGNVNLSDADSIDQIIFVNAHSQEPDVDYADSRTDTLMVLLRHQNNASGESLRVSVTFDPDAENRIRLTIGTSVVGLNLFHDFHDMALRRSLWPVTFSDKNKSDQPGPRLR